MLLIVAFGVPEYLRDVLMLPFYGDRILFIDLYIALFVMLFCRLRAADPAYARGQPPPRLGGVAIEPTLHALLFVALVFFAGAFYHGGASFFAPLQASVVALTLAGVALMVASGEHISLLDKAERFLTVIILWQLVVFAIGRVQPLSLEMAASRNLWAYSAVLLFALNRWYRRPGAVLLFLKVVAVISINGTKAAFGLLAVVVVAQWLQRAASTRPLLRFAFCFGFLSAIIAAHVVLYRYTMKALRIGSLETFRYLGQMDRTGVENQLDSAISRVFSVPYTLKFVLEHNAVVGVGAAEAARITFWGYPVHNLFVSYIAVFGVVGLAFGVLYLGMCFRIARASLTLFAVALFVPMVSNDLYPILAFCLLPLMTEPFRHATQEARLMPAAVFSR